jgi:hypothetical protein
MSNQGTRTEIGTVVGRGPDTPYVLIGVADERQLMVNKKAFCGDWHALKRGDVLALITDGGPAVAKVLSARLSSSAAE